MIKGKDTYKNGVLQVGTKKIKLRVTTADYLITGEFLLPIDSVVENPTIENLLFYALNSGNMFMALHNCTIMTKTHVEYQPEHVDYYNINLNIVHSCRIIKED